MRAVVPLHAATIADGNDSTSKLLGTPAGTKTSTPSPRSSRSQSSHEVPVRSNASRIARYRPSRTATWCAIGATLIPEPFNVHDDDGPVNG